MNAFFSTFTGNMLLLVLTIGSGIWVSNSGKPYHTAVFTVHKLLAVGTIFIIARNLYRLQDAASLSAISGPGALVLTGTFFVALIVSGALLSLQDAALLNLPVQVLGLVHTAHQVTPILTLLGAGLSLKLLTGIGAA